MDRLSALFLDGIRRNIVWDTDSYIWRSGFYFRRFLQGWYIIIMIEQGLSTKKNLIPFFIVEYTFDLYLKNTFSSGVEFNGVFLLSQWINMMGLTVALFNRCSKDEIPVLSKKLKFIPLYVKNEYDTWSTFSALV